MNKEEYILEKKHQFQTKLKFFILLIITFVVSVCIIMFVDPEWFNNDRTVVAVVYFSFVGIIIVGIDLLKSYFFD